MNTHEYYVSLEVAKLLREVGFDWECNHYYFTQNDKTEEKSDFRHPAQNYNARTATMDSKSFEFEVFSRPTLDVTRRWLREVKGKEVEIDVFPDELVGTTWGFQLYDLDTYDSIVCSNPYTYKTYEQAQEAGIKKVLEIILEKGE